MLLFLRKLTGYSAPYTLAFALFLMGVPWIPVFAQRYSGPVTPEDRDIGEINRHLNSIDSLDIQRRLTVLETILQESRDAALVQKLSSVGTGLLLGERALRIIVKKRKEDEEEE